MAAIPERYNIMNLIISNICRAILSPMVLALVKKAGITPIPSDLMPPRQIKITGEPELGWGWSKGIPATLTPHRGQLIPTINSHTAEQLVDETEEGSSHKAEYLPQSLLVCSRDEYLADSQVTGDEFRRVGESNADLVVVAVIGDNRSSLAVVRNMAEITLPTEIKGDGLMSELLTTSGYNEMWKQLTEMKEQATDALEATNIFLIED
jgi:hypothetical protein